jgi:hypothetical protein
VVGQRWDVMLNGLPPGLQERASSVPRVSAAPGRACRWPIDLTPLGAPGAFGTCRGHHRPADRDGHGHRDALRADPRGTGLVGQRFYEQILWLDPAANSLGIVTDWSRAWTIGSPHLPAASIMAAIDSGSTTRTDAFVALQGYATPVKLNP